MLQLMSCGMFGFGTMAYTEELCFVTQHRAQECIYHFIHVLWTASFFIHTLRKNDTFGAASSVLDSHTEISREAFNYVGTVLSSSRTNSANSHDLCEHN